MEENKSGYVGEMPKLTLCQKRNCDFGAYVKLDHEPSAKEVASASEKILCQLLSSIFIRKLEDVRIIVRSVDEEEISDPLVQEKREPTGEWTIGVKISCYDAMFGYPSKYDLKEGVTPEPMEI